MVKKRDKSKVISPGKIRELNFQINPEEIIQDQKKIKYDVQNDILRYGTSSKALLFWACIGLAGLLFGGCALVYIIRCLLLGDRFAHFSVHAMLTGLGFGGVSMWILLANTTILFEFGTGQIVSSGIFGLFGKTYSTIDIEEIEVHFDDLPMQGISIKIGLFGNERLTFDYRVLLQSHESKNMLLLAVYLAGKFNKPLVFIGNPKNAHKDFIKIYNELTTIK